jgi:hypothetical protein
MMSTTLTISRRALLLWVRRVVVGSGLMVSAAGSSRHACRQEQCQSTWVREKPRSNHNLLYSRVADRNDTQFTCNSTRVNSYSASFPACLPLLLWVLELM